MSAPEHGVRYRLDHVRGSDPVAYRGTLDGAFDCGIEVVIVADPSQPDGARAETRLTGAPAALEATIARTAAVMVKSALRRAQRDGLPPPRRIHRWREH